MIFFKIKHNYYLVKEISFKNDMYNEEKITLVKKIPKNSKLKEYILIKQLIMTKYEAKKYIENIVINYDKYLF